LDSSINLAIICPSQTMARTILDFADATTARDWKAVDDVVMGGRSHSSVSWHDEDVAHDSAERGFLRFEGVVSLQNNGGFCSARLTCSERGVPGIDELRLIVRGDGQRYKFTVRTDDTPDKTSWRLPFEAPTSGWSELTFALADFELWRRGNHLSPQTALDPARITSFGLLISDEQQGRFCIDLTRLEGR
jgi:monofunctional biosynthetic peptidoglycan transglycosylase